MKGQVTIFIILGLVIALSIAAVIFIAQANSPQTQPTETEQRDLNPEVCLQRGLTLAIAGLQDDGVLTQSELGPLADQIHPYLVKSTTLRQGAPRYYGLCSRTGPNGLQNGVSCQNNVYTINQVSIQDQLQQAVTNHMHACLEDTSGETEILIQRDTIQAIHSQPQAQASQQLPLTSIWSAINVFLQQQATDLEYTGEGMRQGCDRCRQVEVTKNIKVNLVDQWYDNYTFSTTEFSVNIFLEDRAILRLLSEENGVATTTLDGSVTAIQHTFFAPDGDEITIDGSAGDAVVDQDENRVTLVCNSYDGDVTLTDGHGHTITVGCES